MEEVKVSDDNLTSAAAFVEGGIQDACDDACSICLEAFCESDPSTVTTCKHEYHLQCILEWCQRSSQCPMCWQSISLKDPGSQELLDAVEHERNVRMNPPRNTTIFHHPTLGDFELQHLPVSASDSELEERIIQHLAAAAAMGRVRQLARREGQRSRPSTQGRPHLLLFSAHPDSTSTISTATPPAHGRGETPDSLMVAGPNSPFITVGEDSVQLLAQPYPAHANQINSTAAVTDQLGPSSSNRRSPNQTSPNNQDRAGPSDFQSFSESLKSRLSALSLRYKDSITKSTRGWKERLFTRNSSTPDTNYQVRREVDPGIATVSRMTDHLEITNNNRTSLADGSNNLVDLSRLEQDEGHGRGTNRNLSLTEDNPPAPCAAGSASK